MKRTLLYILLLAMCSCAVQRATTSKEFARDEIGAARRTLNGWYNRFVASPGTQAARPHQHGVSMHLACYFSIYVHDVRTGKLK